MTQAGEGDSLSMGAQKSVLRERVDIGPRDQDVYNSGDEQNHDPQGDLHGEPGD